MIPTDNGIWRWIWAAVALLCAVAISYVLISLAVDAQSEPRQSDLYANIEFDPMLLELDKLALDQAYSDQIKKLFMVWLSSQAGDATQFTNGLRIARRAYHQAAQQIAKREQEIEERKRGQQR